MTDQREATPRTDALIKPDEDDMVVLFNEMLEHARQLERELAASAERIAELEQWVSDLQSGMFVNCVYCGHRYGPADKVPATMADALKQHIEQCPKHPMSALKSELAAARAQLAEAQKDAERMRALINTPQTDEWFEAVRLEAAHQQERWGSAHDAGKTPADWFWLVGYLAGKSLHAVTSGNAEKGLHHNISTSAALLNWHRYMTGEMTEMRPGIEPPDGDRARGERT